MKALHFFWIMMPMLLVAGCASNLKESQRYYQFNDQMIGAYSSVDVEQLNNAITNINADEHISPVRLVLVALKINSDQEALLISQEFPNIEEKNRVVIIIVRDGYPDDAIRGEWNKLELQRQVDGSWKILTAKHAVSCWRSDSHIFQNSPCP